MRSFLITLAIVLLCIGLFWPIVSKIPLFRLPGDIVINRPATSERPAMKIFIPVTSTLVITLLLNILLRFIKH